MRIIMLLLLWLLVYTGSTHGFNNEKMDSIISELKRNILQESVLECILSVDQITNYYNESTKIWLINDEDLLDDLNNDIQSIVDCANDDDYIMFNTENAIVPNDTISISKNLVFSYYTDNVDYENDVFPETETKAIFNCPDDKAIFDIISASVTLANIEISQCELTKQSATSPVLFSNTCVGDEFSNDGTVKFHHVNFKNNKNHDQAACFSANSTICSSLEIINSRFEENESGGYVIGNLLPITTLNDVTMNNNTFLRGKMFNLPATLMISDNNEELIIDNLNAYSNIGLILAIENGIASIENSSFEDNTGSLMFPVLPACITGTNSEIIITSSTFSRAMPIFVDVVESSLEISGCLFENLNENGLKVGNYSGIRTRESELVIENSNFYYNHGYDTAGALKNDNSNVKIDGSIFFANTGQRGGALFVECQLEICEVNITNSYFVANTAYYTGGAIRLLSDYEAYVSNTTFYQNSAAVYGGALATKNYLINTITIYDSTFMYNTADDSYGAIYLSGDLGGIAVGELSNCLIQNNNSTFLHGGGIGGWFASIEINGGTISNNSGVRGGGIAGIGSEIILNDVDITENSASLDGGGIYLDYYLRKSNLTIINSSINQNICESNGGAIMCRNGCDINITDSEMNYNQAGVYGGAMNTISGTDNTNINIENTEGSSNLAVDRGGFIHAVNDFDLNIINSDISDNVANNFGGALYLEDSLTRSNFIISGSTFNRNVGTIGASVILTMYDIDGTILNSTFKNNTCLDDIGGVIQARSGIWSDNQTLSDLGYYTPYTRLMEARENAGTTFLNSDNLLVPSVTFVLENNEFSGNRADIGRGSIMYIYDGCLFVNKNCSFIDNYSYQYSNINIRDSEFYCEDCIFTNNMCTEHASVLRMRSVLDEGVSSNSTLFLKNCIISDNISEEGEGTISVSNSRSIIENSIFSNNKASEGAAMSLEHANIILSNLNFEYNSAESRGGVLYIDENTNITVENSVFEFNEVTSEESQGGVIYGSSEESFSYATFTNCSFTSNSLSGSGGASYLRGLFVVSISDSQFKYNEANSNQGIGASFVAIGENWMSDETETTLNVVYSNKIRSDVQEKYDIVGVSRDNGLPSFELKLDNVLFEENQAEESQTGALHIEDGVVADLNNCVFTKNSGSNDGAIHIQNSEFYCNVCSFTENQSYKTGAGVARLSSDYTEGNATEICLAVFKDSIFESNKAAESGGAILLDNENTALYILENNTFENNSARNGGAISVNDRGHVYCYESSFIANVANEKGGALDLNIEENEGMKYYLKNCSFIRNKADIGGAIHLFENIEILEFCSTLEIECPDMVAIYLNSLTMSGNSAEIAGGAIMISNPHIIYIECEYNEKEVDFEINGGFEDMAINRYGNDSFLNAEMCKNWEKNTVSETGYGETNATYGRSVSLEVSSSDTIAMFSEAIENEMDTIFNVTGLKSGEILPDLLLVTRDGFNLGPAYIMGKNLNVSVYSPDELFAGTIIYDMNDGNITLNSLKLIGQYGIKNVHLNFSLDNFNDIVLQVNLRECVIGEEYREETTFCLVCNIFEYNFEPMTTFCEECPEHASCAGNAIEPNDGYWHVSPCSRHIKKCIADDACKKDFREIYLYNYSQNLKSCYLNENDYDEYEGLQCREGYMGPLCGSCKDDYGKMGSFECSKCSKLSYSYLFFIFSGIWFLILTAIAIKGNLASKPEEFQSDGNPIDTDTHDQDQDQDQDQEEINGDDEKTKEEVLQEKEGNPSSSERVGEIEAETFSPSQKAKLAVKTSTQIYTIHQSDIKKRTITETFKVGINYLQVTAIAISININWSKSMKSFLSLLDFVGGISGATTIVSLDCILTSGYRIEKSIIRAILAIIWPTFILTLVVFFWFTFATLKRKGIKHLIRRSLLTCVVVAYLSYINVTKSLVKVLYCDEIYNSRDYDKIDNSRYLWLEDTNIECHTEDHLYLTIFAAILIAAFSFGYPIIIVIYLLKKRESNSLDKNWVYETMGFLYRAYRHKLVYWDSIIMARKGILAAIVVFGYPLGGNLQGILAVFVLLISLTANMILLPFKRDYHLLNICEAASLFVSTVTFTAGLLFNDDRSGPGLKMFTAIVLISLNTSLILSFLIIMLISAFMFIKIKLIVDKKADLYDNWFHILKKGFKHVYWTSKPKLQKMASKLRSSVSNKKLFSPRHSKRSSQSGTIT